MRAAKRLQNLPPYPFATLERRIAELKSKGMDIVRLDIGSPDLPPPPFIVEALYKSAQAPTNHGYPGYYGTPQLRRAIADYYARRFGVELDPKEEALVLIGSKEGLAHASLAFLDPGDLALIPDPGYPTYYLSTLLAGGEVYYMPLLAENEFFPDFSAIPTEIAERARLMWLGYPNNPTGATANLDSLSRAVDFARAHDILLCHDNPYCDLTYDGYLAPSILQIPGAKEVGIEFNSLSKTYNMAGWRVGMAVGNAEAIKALALVKSNVDSGVFLPIQDAAVAALTGDQSWIPERNAIYQERRDIVMEGLKELGLEAERPKAALYVWVRIPAGCTSQDFATRLLEEKGVSVAPGNYYGPSGEGYVRISLTIPPERLREGMRRMREFEF